MILRWCWRGRGEARQWSVASGQLSVNNVAIYTSVLGTKTLSKCHPERNRLIRRRISRRSRRTLRFSSEKARSSVEAPGFSRVITCFLFSIPSGRQSARNPLKPARFHGKQCSRKSHPFNPQPREPANFCSYNHLFPAHASPRLVTRITAACCIKACNQNAVEPGGRLARRFKRG